MTTPIGIETHTFSLIGRCQRTGRLGVAVTTSSITVGSRCPFVRPFVGAVSTQNLTDPRLGPFALRLMEMGYSARRALQEIESSDPYIERRQLGLVDRDGNSAARTGSLNGEWAGHIIKRNYVAMGNGLVGEQVIQAMSLSFQENEQDTLEERLLRAVEAGQDAGGEAQDLSPQHSAALLVYDTHAFPRVDLRVDEHPKPLVELRRIFEIYKPQIDYFLVRASDPEAAQSLKESPER